MFRSECELDLQGLAQSGRRLSDHRIADKDLVAVGGYSRRHLSGETAIRQSARAPQLEPKRPIRNFEGHEVSEERQLHLADTVQGVVERML